MKRTDEISNQFYQWIQEADIITIAGHIRPDGDCVGSCAALYLYIKKNLCPGTDKKVKVFMEAVPESFQFLNGTSDFVSEPDKLTGTELFISLDSGSIDRLGRAEEYFKNAKHTVVIDHHISNTGYAGLNIVDAEASSTCEVLFELMEEEKLDLPIAQALYLGIVHDTGVFKHSNTRRRTMEIAGALLEQGVSSSEIIDGTFYEKTYLQNQILGRCLMESILLFDGKIIVSSVSKKVQELYQTKTSDFEGVIDNLRVTKGVEVAILMTEEEPLKYKVSLRSNGIVDVSKIAVFFGGGGHIKASGCTMIGTKTDVINNLTIGIESQLKGK